jgi:hypothetical protein
MRIGRPFAGILAFAGLLVAALNAHAAPPADDFLRVQKPGPHLTLMPFIGPGFRATYDHRFELEKEVSELRTQVIGTVAIPFAEVSANVDIRLFLMLFGGSIGYHDEWHVLQFNPDPKTGYDRAGQSQVEVDTSPAGVTQHINTDPGVGFNDLNRNARALKDQYVDQRTKSWAFYEGRWGFVWPAYGFTAVSNLAARHDGRPNVTYDWENGTVLNGGWNFRWEGYFLFQARNAGFIGPALRAMVVPRFRTHGPFTTESGVILPDESACQPGVVPNLACYATHEFEFHYGILAGLRPNWVSSADTLLIRAYTTWGLNNKLFGTQVFRQPIQLLFAYMVDIDL